MTEADECAEMVYQRHMDIYPIASPMAAALAYVYFSHETDTVRAAVADALMRLNAKAEAELDQRFRLKAKDLYAGDDFQIHEDAKVSRVEPGCAWVEASVYIDLKESSND
jgi:hypothetical protein